MNKSTFGLIAASALLLTPVAAFAQDSQSNLQIGNNSAAAVGEGHFINQVGIQQSTQTQVGFDDYYGGYGEPSSQTSIQDNGNAASAVGGYSVINQAGVQTSDQTNVDIDTYPAYYPHY